MNSLSRLVAVAKRDGNASLDRQVMLRGGLSKLDIRQVEREANAFIISELEAMWNR